MRGRTRSDISWGRKSRKEWCHSHQIFSSLWKSFGKTLNFDESGITPSYFLTLMKWSLLVQTLISWHYLIHCNVMPLINITEWQTSRGLNYTDRLRVKIVILIRFWSSTFVLFLGGWLINHVILSQSETKTIVATTEQIKFFHSKWPGLKKIIVVSEKSCHFVNFQSFSRELFFVSAWDKSRDSWTNSQKLTQM